MKSPKVQAAEDWRKYEDMLYLKARRNGLVDAEARIFVQAQVKAQADLKHAELQKRQADREKYKGLGR